MLPGFTQGYYTSWAVPVLCGSSYRNSGPALLDAVVTTSLPQEVGAVKGINLKTGRRISVAG